MRNLIRNSCPCAQGLRLIKRTPADGTEMLVAEMPVGYALIRETFTCRVALDKARLKIRVEYIDGPFSRLENLDVRRRAECDGLQGRILHLLRV